MRQHHRLPFPVRDTSDLKRAIKYASRPETVDPSTQRYIIQRARVLGHADLLPTSWTHMTTTTQHDVTLDEQIEQLASRFNLSEAQLKTVYLRGVDAFFESDITYGSATMYGLARVQRFINERGMTVDCDLVATNESESVDCGIELSAGMFFSSDIIYARGEKVASFFEPGTVTSIVVTDEMLEVRGQLGTLEWCYQLNIVTGAHSFDVQ